MSTAHTVKAHYVRSIGRVHIVKLSLNSKQKEFWKENINPDYLNEDDKGNITTVISRSLMPVMNATRPVNYTFGFNKAGEFFSGPDDNSGAVDDAFESLIKLELAKKIAEAQFNRMTGGSNRTTQAAPAQTQQKVADIPFDAEETEEGLSAEEKALQSAINKEQ